MQCEVPGVVSLIVYPFPVDDECELTTTASAEREERQSKTGAKYEQGKNPDDSRFQWERNQVDCRKANAVLLVVEGQGHSPNLNMMVLVVWRWGTGTSKKSHGKVERQEQESKSRSIAIYTR